MDKDITITVLSGKAGVGKDYIARELWEKIDLTQNITPNIISYGDSLRAELTSLGWDIENKVSNYPYHAEYLNRAIAKKYKIPVSVVDYLEKRKVNETDFYSEDRNPRYREFMQYYGTDVRRKQDPEYWINDLVFKVLQYAEASNDGLFVIIPDARFENEITVLKDLFNHVYAFRLNDDSTAIDARESKRDSTVMTSMERKHSSEVSLDNFTGFDRVFNRAKESSADIVNSIVKEMEIPRVVH